MVLAKINYSNGIIIVLFNSARNMYIQIAKLAEKF